MGGTQEKLGWGRKREKRKIKRRKDEEEGRRKKNREKGGGREEGRGKEEDGGRDPKEKLLEDFEQSMTCSISFLKTAVCTGVTRITIGEWKNTWAIWLKKVTSESDWILCRFIG